MASKLIPFQTDDTTKANAIKDKGIEAMKTASKIAEEKGIVDMSLEEINSEISHTRNKAKR